MHFESLWWWGQASVPAKRAPKTTAADTRAGIPEPSPPAFGTAWEPPAAYAGYSAAPLNIPPGYVLVAPNLLLPIEALQARPQCYTREQ